MFFLIMPVIFVTVEYKILHIFAVIKDHINRSLIFSVSGKFFACELFWHGCTYLSIKYSTNQVFPRWVQRNERVLVHGLWYRFYHRFVTTCLHAVAVKIFLYCLSPLFTDGTLKPRIRRYPRARLDKRNHLRTSKYKLCIYRACSKNHIYPNLTCRVPKEKFKMATQHSVISIDIYLSGLLARHQNAWSQDGGNMRVIANGVNRWPVSRLACGPFALVCFGMSRYAA